MKNVAIFDIFNIINKPLYRKDFHVSEKNSILIPKYIHICIYIARATPGVLLQSR